MNRPQSEDCKKNWISDLLDNTLPSAHQELLIEHLDRCDACRQLLDDSASDVRERESLKNALKSDSNFRTDESRNSFFGNNFNGPYDRLELAWVREWLEPTENPKSLGSLGPFEVIRLIGTGGMGVVFQAREPSLGRFVAIKVLSPYLAKSETARQRFEREARAAASLIHDNIISIHQVSEWKSLPYLVMQYFPEASLQQYLERQGKMNLTATLSIGLQIANGLAAAHSQGIVHRDIKPANILLANEGERAILTDFGLAQTEDDLSLTRTGVLAGTPHFMSPEQARGETVDPKSDLFSLGSVLFTMVTGTPPIESRPDRTTMSQIADGELPSLRRFSADLPIWFIEIVDRLHAASKEKRPSSAAIVASWIEKCLAHLRDPKTHSVPFDLTTRQSPSSRFRRIWIATGMATAIGSLLLCLYFFSPSFRDSFPSGQPPRNLGSNPYGVYSYGSAFGDRIAKILPADVDSEYELADVTVANTDDSKHTVSRRNSLPGDSANSFDGVHYPMGTIRGGPALWQAMEGAFNFQLPIDSKYEVRSIWRLREGKDIQAKNVHLTDELEWNSARHEQVTLLPPDKRPSTATSENQ